MADDIEFPPVTGQDILNCSFSSWYAKYHRLSPRARIIKPLPESFLNFLKSDGIVIPGGYLRSSTIMIDMLTFRNCTSLISEIEETDSDADVESSQDKSVTQSVNCPEDTRILIQLRTLQLS